MSQPPYPPPDGTDPSGQQPGQPGWGQPGADEPTQRLGPTGGPAFGEGQRNDTTQFPGPGQYGPPPGQYGPPPQYGQPGQYGPPPYGQPGYGQQPPKSNKGAVIALIVGGV